MSSFECARSRPVHPTKFLHVLARWASLAVVGVAAAAVGCNDHPTRLVEPRGATEFVERGEASTTTKLDLLWVLDNSGSMCEEQRALQKQFPKFVDALSDRPVDAHIAVTTTDVSSKDSCAPATSPQTDEARFDGGPGCLQSRPRPTTGFEGSCRYTNEDGTLRDGEEGRAGPEYGPVRRQLAQARSCVQDPANWEHLKPENVPFDLIHCALTGDRTACQNAPRPTDHIACELDGDAQACNASGRPSDGQFDIRDLFPPRDAYRDVPKVLRTSAYETGGELDLDRLGRDFECMSTVGTRGGGLEQGLRALVRAVDPERTGGPADVEDPPNPEAPNHGFLRKDAHFGAVFVTDENDCSHRGGLGGEAACGEARCYFPNRPGEDGPPLTEIRKLHGEFLDNLAGSKGVERVPSDRVLLGIIHGGYAPFQSLAERPDSCSIWRQRHDGAPVAEVVPRTCVNEFGVARSGDRYEEFLRKGERFFPELADPSTFSGEPIPGELCTGGALKETFREMGRFFNPGDRLCIERELPSCSGPSDCPAPQFETEVPICADSPVGDSGMCRSATELRLVAPSGLERPREKLRATGFCVGDSLESTGEGARCVVRPTLYEWRACPGGGGITYAWKAPGETDGQTEQVDRRVADLEIEIRYLGVPESRSRRGAESRAE